MKGGIGERGGEETENGVSGRMQRVSVGGGVADGADEETGGSGHCGCEVGSRGG